MSATVVRKLYSLTRVPRHNTWRISTRKTPGMLALFISRRVVWKTVVNGEHAMHHEEKPASINHRAGEDPIDTLRWQTIQGQSRYVSLWTLLNHENVRANLGPYPFLPHPPLLFEGGKERGKKKDGTVTIILTRLNVFLSQELKPADCTAYQLFINEWRLYSLFYYMV